jgi:DNA-binding MarR family transcriptional regulator
MKSSQVQSIREALRRFNRHAGVLKSDPYGIGLSLSQSSALVDLARLGPLKANELVRLLKLEKSSVSRLMSVLSDAGLIQVKSDPSDGRVKVLNLTAAGRKLAGVINKVSNRSVLEVFSVLGAREQAELVSAFEKLRTAVEAFETRRP